MKVQQAKIFLLKRIAPIIFVLIVVGYFFLQQNALDKRISSSVNSAKILLENENVLQGILGSNYADCMKDASKCALTQEEIFYKKVDIYLDFVFLKIEPISTSGLEEKISTSGSFLRNVIAQIHNETIDYSYIDSSRAHGDIAMDTTCILGWTYNDTYLYQRMRGELKDYGWTNPNTTEPFRKLIDETWCISLLAENNENKSTVFHLVDLKKQEFSSYINGNDYVDRKIIGGLHLLLMFNRLQKYGYDISPYDGFVNSVEGYVVNTTQSAKLVYPIEVYHNDLYILSLIRYSDKQFLQNLAEKLLQMQNADGSWYATPDGQISMLETQRAMIALNLFKVNYL